MQVKYGAPGAIDTVGLGMVPMVISWQMEMPWRTHIS